MINIVICDDEKRILEEISLYIKRIFEKSDKEVQICMYENPIELLRYAEDTKIDVLLLDIEFPNTDGMEVAEKLNDLGTVELLIFLTSHESHVFESFKYRPFDFIRKRYYVTELSEALKRAMHILANTKKEYVIEQAEGIRSVLFDKIVYFESNANYVKIVLDGEVLQQRKNMQQIEMELADYGFIRIHKGFLVNQRMIHVVKTDKVILKNGEELPIGRSYKEEAKQKILKYFRG